MILKIEEDTGASSRGKPFTESMRTDMLIKAVREHADKNNIYLPHRSDDSLFRLERGEHGKPFFADALLSKIHFSISHSGSYFAIIVADNEVGIDIEDLTIRSEKIIRYERIAARFFTVDEIAYLGRTSDTGYVHRFFRVWTGKEAYLKYTGEGYFGGMSGFSIFSLPNPHLELNVPIDERHVICTICGHDLRYCY